MGYFRHGYTVVLSDSVYEVSDFMQAVTDVMRPVTDQASTEFNDPYKLDLYNGYADIQTGEEHGTFLFAEWYKYFDDPNIEGADLDPTFVRTEGIVKTNMPEWLQIPLEKTTEQVVQQYKEQDERLAEFMKTLEEK